MAIAEPSLTVGIEEEYLLVDRRTRDLASDPPADLMRACEARLGERVSGEFLRSQIEIGTKVCETIQEARADLAELRGCVAEVADEFGLAPIAASTHPFANWHAQQYADKERYHDLARDMQAAARRLLICGMHVHVGIEDEDLRIDLMNQVSYFLPHLLALSTSSPFWQGEKTGLKSFRLTVFDGLPRTGVPERFDSYGEFQRLVRLLVGSGGIEDATKIWWDLRPSARYPTLEMRMTDVCTRLDDAVCVAAIYRCLVRMLYRLRQLNQRWRVYPLICVEENRWRAQRHGTGDTLVDFGRGEAVPYGDLLHEILELTAVDAAALDSVAEVEQSRDILRRGTSADVQMRVFDEAVAAGAEPVEAARAVVDWLIGETVHGL